MIKYIKYETKDSTKIIMRNKSNLLCLLVLFFVILFAAELVFAKPMKRDPFVPLVDQEGNIRKGEDLFMPTKDILPQVILKGILWDEKNPLAVINNKVLSEGQQVPLGDEGFSRNIILEKINEDSVILNYNGREFTIKLRKKEKE